MSTPVITSSSTVWFSKRYTLWKRSGSFLFWTPPADPLCILVSQYGRRIPFPYLICPFLTVRKGESTYLIVISPFIISRTRFLMTCCCMFENDLQSFSVLKILIFSLPKKEILYSTFFKRWQKSSDLFCHFFSILDVVYMISSETSLSKHYEILIKFLSD